MTQEERLLLLKDLCARLPVWNGGVIVQYIKNGHRRIGELQSIWRDGGGIKIYPIPVWLKDSSQLHLYADDEWSHCHCCEEDQSLDTIKPYLRPMSSMTEEEKEEFESVLGHYDENNNPYEDFNFGDDIDWLNAHHFDYRGLIEKGLALEAPEDMYKTE